MEKSLEIRTGVKRDVKMAIAHSLCQTLYLALYKHNPFNLSSDAMQHVLLTSLFSQRKKLRLRSTLPKEDT